MIEIEGTQRKLPDQLRAKAALDAVNSEEARKADKYATYVKGLPALVRNAGLGQAVATFMARAQAVGKDAKSYEAIVKHLEMWLCDQCEWSPYCAHESAGERNVGAPKRGQRLLCRIVEGDQHAFMRATTEAVAYLDWLKKLANALLDEEAHNKPRRVRQAQARSGDLEHAEENEDVDRIENAEKIEHAEEGGGGA